MVVSFLLEHHPQNSADTASPIVPDMHENF